MGGRRGGRLSAGLSLGRRVDPDDLQVTDEPAGLDPDHLTRHAVCVGMTGSGKTGLCVTLLEELVLAGVPVIAVDPKGDLANLAFAFRDHAPADFEPWVDPGEAAREGRTPAEHAAALSTIWREGLEAWDVPRERVHRLVDALDLQVLTPGSTAGVPVDVLGVLGRPPVEPDDEEGLVEAARGAVQAILGLAGVRADPSRDPEHIVLARLLEQAWRDGSALDLEALVLQLVDPPFEKVGVFPLETFFPRDDRMQLALKLNGVLASPSFASWSEGVPLDPAALLEPTGDGRVPVRVVYLAHLDDAARTFAVSLLLSRMVAWARRQPGTSALRAVLFFDEVWGWLPPHPHDPPSKRPLLTLLKQGRGVGLGVVLCTQNPVDVDYKALSNAATWWVGRLSTPQDRDRVLDGMALAPGGVDRGTVGAWIDRLPKRVFVQRQASARAPQLLHTRFAMSWLRGPLTRREVERLPAAQWSPGAREASAPSRDDEAPPQPEPAAADEGLLEAPPSVPLPVAWLAPERAHSAHLAPWTVHASGSARSDGRTVWRPALLATLRCRFDEGRHFESEREEHRVFFPLDGDDPDCVEPELQDGDLDGAPADGLFAPLPLPLDDKTLRDLERRVVSEVVDGETDRMYRHRPTKLVSRAGEDEAAFRERVRAALQDEIDRDVAKLREKVEKTVERLEDKREKAEERLSRYKADARGKMATEVVNVGETLFGMLFGGRRRSITTAVNKRNATAKAAERVTSTEEDLAELERELYEAEAELATQILAIENEHLRTLDDIESTEVGLERDDVHLEDWTLLWVPSAPALPEPSG